MKKLFIFLFVAFITTSTFALTSKEEIKNIFLWGNDELKNFYMQKNCQSAIKIIKENFIIDEKEENPGVAYVIIHGFMSGIADEDSNCLINGKIMRKNDLHKYKNKVESQLKEFFDSNDKNELNFKNSDIEYMTMLLGYYYATKNEDIPKIMRLVVDKEKYCLGKNETDTLKCPTQETTEFATEFLKMIQL